jgi:hypothetical protein
LLAGAVAVVVATAWTLSRGKRREPFIPNLMALPPVVVTDWGLMDTERDYLPGVVDCEMAHYTESQAALQAQAIAARTYLARYLSTRGVAARVPIGPHFQCWRRPVHARSADAVRRTRGMFMRWKGNLINANYVAGAPVMDGDCDAKSPRDNGLPFDDWEAVRKEWQKGRRWREPAWTHIFVTDNRSRRGDAVRSTLIGSWGPPNRGALGQYRAICLAGRGRGRDEILRTFYGADVMIGP